ncbi:hypothetical protein LXL04_024300 [Taraxacum kok-saghyz]
MVGRRKVLRSTKGIGSFNIISKKYKGFPKWPMKAFTSQQPGTPEYLHRVVNIQAINIHEQLREDLETHIFHVAHASDEDDVKADDVSVTKDDVVVDDDYDDVVDDSEDDEKIGNGEDTRFWEDCWLGDKPLSLRFPRLFVLEGNGLCMVADRWDGSAWRWDWQRRLEGGRTFSEFQALLGLLDSVGCGVYANSRYLGVGHNFGW